jgi:hypothetical protein
MPIFWARAPTQRRRSGFDASNRMIFSRVGSPSALKNSAICITISFMSTFFKVYKQLLIQVKYTISIRCQVLFSNKYDLSNKKINAELNNKNIARFITISNSDWKYTCKGID